MVGFYGFFVGAKLLLNYGDLLLLKYLKATYKHYWTFTTALSQTNSLWPACYSDMYMYTVSDLALLPQPTYIYIYNIYIDICHITASQRICEFVDRTTILVTKQLAAQQQYQQQQH